MKKRVLVATDDAAAIRAIRDSFHSGHRVTVAGNKTQFFKLFEAGRPEITFVDIRLLASKNGSKQDRNLYRQALDRLYLVYPNVDIIIMADQGTIREAVYAVKAGASYYLTYPIDPTEVEYIIESIKEDRKQRSELAYLRGQFWKQDSLHLAETKSPAMAKVFDKIRSVSVTRTTVMLYGETGTGKGVIAKIIHRSSSRRKKQFISVHCGAIPDTLLESELFGHEKGAFTGADKRKLGKFETAHGGTIFLDEIGTVSASAQIKLLQVLQDRTFQRVGGEITLESDCRVVAATNADLKEMADAGAFRKDLYYRLNVFPIEIPALRDRPEDIPLLVAFFLEKLNTLYEKEIQQVHPSVIKALEAYDWPGNIRELENLIERAYILESTPELTPESFPGELFVQDKALAQVPFNPQQSLAEVRAKGVENIERQYLKEVLMANRGRIDKSAQEARISTRQLHKLLKKYDIRKEDYKA
jgi:DNA-binding NtrC family response regulator